MLTFPEPIENPRCYLLCIDETIVPIVAGLFARACNRYEWATDEDHERAYNTFTYLRGCMLACRLDELLESNNRLYRLVDRAYFGTEYSLVSNEPLVITPPISSIPDSEANWPGVVWQIEDVRTKLQALIDQGTSQGNLEGEMLEELISIAALLV